MKYDNEMKVEFISKSINEGFARMTVVGFITSLDPTIEELADIKTAVSEAVTNAIVHAYDDEVGKVVIKAHIIDRVITIQVKDYGKGIEDVSKAIEPLYTSKPDLERSGMGFTVMESFMDKVSVRSKVGKGTTIIMRKKLS